MTLREFLDELLEMVEKQPEIANYLVIYSSDDEGNSFHPVHTSGTLGCYNKADKEFISNTEDYLYLDINESDKNAICIN